MNGNVTIQYIRKNGRKKGRKKGVMIGFPNPEQPDQIIIGWSLCNPLDEFDVIGGKRKKGFGLELATDRAFKFANHEGYFFQNTYTENSTMRFTYQNTDPKNVVEIPGSMEIPLKNFIKRCKGYYKDKNFSNWVNLVHEDVPFLTKEGLPKLEITDMMEEVGIEFIEEGRY